MTGRDLLSDCSALFMKYSCKILLSIAAAAFSASFWYASKLDDQNKVIQETLQHIQTDIAIIRTQQGLAPYGVAGNP